MWSGRRPIPAVHYRRRRDDTELSLPAGRHYDFPEGFLWGAATASHQVEGGDRHSDWWRFERQPGRVAGFAEAGAFARDHKSDHWRRFPDDIEMMKRDLGVGAYRFSLDWSRIEPQEGQFDGAVIDRYAQMCALMRERGIQPVVTLFHWSSPDWIWDPDREEQTGWFEGRIVERFRRYCDVVVAALSPHVDLWVSLNEPNVFVYGAFAEGVLAPGHRRDDAALFDIFRNLLGCHRAAWEVIKGARPDARVGVGNHFAPVEPFHRHNPLEGWLAARVEQAFSWAFPDAIRDGTFWFTSRKGKSYRELVPALRDTASFTGVNYYQRAFLRLPHGIDLCGADIVADLEGDRANWPREINTRRFVEILATAQRRYRLPILITENGCADTDEARRRQFMKAHIRAVGHAINDHGIDVRGFFYWSLLDNQEWAHGFVPRFGLYAVDFADGTRMLRPAGETYAEVIRANRITA